MWMRIKLTDCILIRTVTFYVDTKSVFSNSSNLSIKLFTSAVFSPFYNWLVGWPSHSHPMGTDFLFFVSTICLNFYFVWFYCLNQCPYRFIQLENEHYDFKPRYKPLWLLYLSISHQWLHPSKANTHSFFSISLLQHTAEQKLGRLTH